MAISVTFPYAPIRVNGPIQGWNAEGRSSGFGQRWVISWSFSSLVAVDMGVFLAF